MNDQVKEILSLVAVAIIAEAVSLVSKKIFKKYRIVERKLSLFVFFMFLFGLFLTVLPVVFLFITISNEDRYSVLGGLLSVLSFLAGALVLGIMVWRVVQMDEMPIVNINPPQVSQTPFVPWNGDTAAKKRNPISGWILVISGLLLTAFCILLFWWDGPQNDPPGMTAAHQQTDMVITAICASAAIIGLVIFGAGVIRLRQKSKPTS